MTAEDVLVAGFDAAIGKAIIGAYSEIERNYVLEKWKPSELDAGHFVEAVRRALDSELTGSYQPIGRSLPPFDDRVLKGYESATGDESYRVLIPRVLKAVYNVRNRRGVAHISTVNPNEMDATLILYSVKWVLAELLRLKSGMSPADTQVMVDEIVERHIPLVWDDDDVTRVIEPTMTAREQCLVLLYKESPLADGKLQRIVEYVNTSNFRAILKRLHKQRLIDYGTDRLCRISPTGSAMAEGIIQKYRRR